MRNIYLDNAATTPLDHRVFEAMKPFLTEHYGNASSVHRPGRKARFAVEESRDLIAGLLGAGPGEIVFTSGGTEANNLAVKGVLRILPDALFVTSPTEHESILRPSESLEKDGRQVTYLIPDAHGRISHDRVTDALSAGCGLLSLMYVNNETGVINPVSEISAAASERGWLYHCDAVQATGVLPLEAGRIGADAFSVSGHKIYGPKGIGMLYIKGGTDLLPLIEGGAQERRRRGGTENVALIVGLATAMQLASREREQRVSHLRRLQLQLQKGLAEAIDGEYVINTPVEETTDTPIAAPHIYNISFPPRDGIAMDGEMLLLNLDMKGIFVSSGSACTSGAVEPSHVLLATGRPRHTASASVRFSFGMHNTSQDVDYVVETLASIVTHMRSKQSGAVQVNS